MIFKRALGLSALVMLLSLFNVADLYALPRMSLTAGTPCAACHVNLQGGGMRTDIGWGSMAWVGALTYDQIGLNSLNEQETNTFFDGKAAIGMDTRIQVAKLGIPVLNVLPDGSVETIQPQRRVIPMQIQPYLSVSATDTLKLYGTYAVGPKTFDGELCDPTYAGQSCFELQAIYQPSPMAPSFRIGQLQPSIGVRHDDHTILIRGDASAPRNPIIAPNYAELGAEVQYQPIYWLQTNFGAFAPRNLAEAIPDERIVNTSDVAGLARIAFMPRWDFEGGGALLTWLGASLYTAGVFQMQNYFLGLGLLDIGSLQLEVSRTDRGIAADHKTLNFMSMLSVPIKNWLVVEGRYERAQTDRLGDEFTTQSAVATVQFFPIPYLELRPEYRYTRTKDYAQGQYTLQVHLFY